jgi:hypothetical protein
MAHKPQTSAVLETVRQRLAGLKKIHPAPDSIADVRGGHSRQNQLQ